jgi:uncharacterized membrane protein YgcG
MLGILSRSRTVLCKHAATFNCPASSYSRLITAVRARFCALHLINMQSAYNSGMINSSSRASTCRVLPRNSQTFPSVTPGRLYAYHSNRQLPGVHSTRSSKQQGSSWQVRAAAGAGGGSSGGGEHIQLTKIRRAMIHEWFLPAASSLPGRTAVYNLTRICLVMNLIHVRARLHLQQRQNACKHVHSKHMHNMCRMCILCPAACAGGKGKGYSSSGGSSGSDPSSGEGGGLFAAYNAALQQHPLLVKALTTAFLSAIGNLICQVFVEKKSDLDWRRINTFTLLGLLWVAPCLHFWYGSLNKIVTLQGNAGEQMLLPD